MRHYPILPCPSDRVRCPKCGGTGRQVNKHRIRQGFYGDCTELCTRCWGTGSIKKDQQAGQQDEG